MSYPVRSHHQPWGLFLLGCALLAVFPPKAQAVDLPIDVPPLGVTLAWDPNPEPDIQGYRIHFGVRPGVYIRTFDVGLQTNFHIPLPAPGRLYFFSATAYNQAGLESELASELRYGAPEGPDPIPTYLRQTSGLEDTAVPLDFSIPDGVPRTEWVFESSPAQGRIAERDGLPVFIPGPNFHGVESFSILLGVESDAPVRITWTITLQPTEDPPVALNAWTTTESDTPLALTLQGSDPDGTPVSFELLTLPKHGTLSGSPPNLTYRSNPGFVGLDMFAFRTSDGALTSAVAQVQIEITPNQGTELVRDQTFNTLEDLLFAFQLDLLDPSITNIRFIEGPEAGSIGGSPPNYFYMPAPDFNGTDRLVVEVTDALGHLDSAVLLFEVEPLNDPPIALPASLEASPGIPVSFTLSGSDPDGDSLVFEIVDEPAKGSITGNPPTFTYTANPDASGSDQLTFRAYDGTTFSETAQITLTVTPPSDPPPRIQAQVLASGVLRLRWTSTPGALYQVVQAENLGSTTWEPLGEPILATADSSDWTGTLRSTPGAVFFAVRRIASAAP